MNGSTAIFTTPATSTNSTVLLPWLMMGKLDIVVFGINVLFGLPTHSYIIWLIITGTGSGIALEFFNLNLSISELLYSLNCLLYVLAVAFPCLLPITQYFLGICINGRPLFQCLICVERYLAVVHPVTFLKFKPLRYRLMCSSVVWIICIGSCIITVFLVNSPVFFQLTLLLSMQFLLFLFIQLFCLVAVLRALKQSGPGDREKEEENHMKRRAFNLILLTSVTTVFLFVPFILAGILTFLQQEVSVCWSVSFFCFILAAFVHPVLYLQRNGKLGFLCSLKNMLFEYFTCCEDFRPLSQHL